MPKGGFPLLQNPSFPSYRPAAVGRYPLPTQRLPLKAMGWLLRAQSPVLLPNRLLSFCGANFRRWRVFHQWPRPTTGFLNYRVI